jgi:hypothetical protein
LRIRGSVVIPLLQHKSLALLLVEAELLDGSGLCGLLVWCVYPPRGMARERRIEARQERSFAAVAFFFGGRIIGK